MDDVREEELNTEPTEKDYKDPEDDTPRSCSLEDPPEPLVNETSREEQVIEEDVTHFNYMLKRSQSFWTQNLDAEDFCKLATTTMKLLEMRRKMMLLRTERERDKGGKGGSFFGAFEDRH